MNKLTADGYRNLASGMGGSKSKVQQGHYMLDLRSDAELVAMYRTSWIARRIVDIPANDATRRWRGWSADKDVISRIEKEEQRLQLPQLVRMAMKTGRLVGVGMLYMSVDDGKERSEPLNVEAVQKGQLKRLSIIPKTSLKPGDIDENPDSLFYGQPNTYTLSKSQTVVHASRMVKFRGEPILDLGDTYYNGSERGWDAESILQSCFSAVRDTDAAISAISEMLQEAKVDILKVPDLMARLAADDDFADKIIERMALANMMKGINNAMIMDTLEELETKQLTFGGVSEVLEKLFQVPAGAAEIPVTRFWGRSPSGLSATGESDLRLHYDTVASTQNNEIGPALEPLNEVMLRSLLGTYNDAIIPAWRPLWAPNENERADLGKKIVDIGKVLIDSRMAAEDTVGQAVVNALIEYEVIPGLETAVDELGREPEEEEKPEVLVPPPANQPNVPLRVVAKGRLMMDAAPRTLYISRKVLNAREVLDHYRSQGFKTFLPEDDLHVTIAYSRAQVDWMKMPQSWQEELEVCAGGPRLQEVLGKEAPFAHVLLFGSEGLQWRHQELREVGATWDWPDYQPHITLSYDEDLSLAEPYTGTLKFGPELWAEVDEDWKAKVTGDAAQPRHPAGSPRGGEFAPKGAGGGGAGGKTVTVGKTKVKGGLTDDEKDAVDDYNQDSSPINAAIRGHAPMYSHVRDTIDNLDSGIAKSSLSQDMDLYRGVSTASIPMGSLKKGAVIEEPAYASTSTNRKRAQEFSEDMNSGEMGYTLQIFARKGMSGLDISAVSGDSSESEILLPRNSKFRVVNVDDTKKTAYVHLL